MDVDEVERAASDLKARASDIDAITTRLDAVVNRLRDVWEGKDADEFVHQWWPQHKRVLQTVKDSVFGLGQSAQNNASEQRQVSGGSATSAGNAASGAHSPSSSAPGSPQASDTTGPVAGAGGGSGQLGSPDPGVIASPPVSKEAYDARPAGPYGPGGDYDGQCTSWVQFRRHELGLVAPTGNGKETAFHLDHSAVPTLGAVGSYANSASDPWGHTFIVEGINAGDPRTIQISEMNVGQWVNAKEAITTGWGKPTTATWTDLGNGQWKGPNGQVRNITFGK
ncbi:CHAP domain-containing protein [Microbacterium sp. B19]|uniref:CHAP domain-containing protein n=1 Tax=Microbacterium sp. B19 TaxID=96765 RepID=UPI0003B73A91|nr:CHAP domain-containing protein [Microbacterium sp. B19]